MRTVVLVLGLAFLVPAFSDGKFYLWSAKIFYPLVAIAEDCYLIYYVYYSRCLLAKFLNKKGFNFYFFSRRINED